MASLDIALLSPVLETLVDAVAGVLCTLVVRVTAPPADEGTVETG